MNVYFTQKLKKFLMKGKNDDSDIETAKIVIVGESMVGKTSMAMCYFEQTNDFKDVQETICAGYFKKKVMLENGEIELVAWDTAGAERYRALTPIYFINASVAIIVYSIDNPQSFEALDSFHQLIMEKAPDVLIYVVGNKIDLENQRKISFYQGKNYADRIHAEDFCEVSALTGENIDCLFTQIAANPKLKKINLQETEANKDIRKKEHKNCC